MEGPEEHKTGRRGAHNRDGCSETGIAQHATERGAQKHTTEREKHEHTTKGKEPEIERAAQYRSKRQREEVTSMQQKERSS
jgi:hypothetical protein